MKVVIGTAHDKNYASLAAITYPSVERYAKKHGYSLLYDDDVTETHKDACKIALYNEALSTGQFGADDVFVWVDTDALIMNSDVRIEQIVYGHMPRSVHYLIGCDVNGLNSGVFIARFSPEAHLFLTVATSMSAAMGWADQEGIIQTAVKEPHKSIYKEIPGKVFNANLYKLKGWDHFGEYGNYVNRYEDGDFILHLAGVGEPERSQLLSFYAELAK